MTFRQFPETSTTRDTSMVSIARNSPFASRGIIGHSGIEKLAVSRATSQLVRSAAKVSGVVVLNPVQFSAAVSTNPAITAAANPNNISWACHRLGLGVGCIQPDSAAIQSNTAIAVCSAASGKKNR